MICNQTKLLDMKRNFNLMSIGFSMLISFLLITGCAKEENISPLNNTLDERGPTASGLPGSSLMYGLSDSMALVAFSYGPPVTELAVMPIKGLHVGERLLAIDIRPRTGQIYAVSDSNLIYILDRNGLAYPVSLTPFTPGIDGTMVGFDINPADDRIRLVTENDQNLRISPVTGQVLAVDVPLSPSQVSINAIAYAVSGSSSSTLSASYSLFDIDMATGDLYRQNFNSGILTFVGSLGINISSEGGFDAQKSGAWAVFNSSSKLGGIGPGNDDLLEAATRLWKIDLQTGIATSYGRMRTLIGLAVPQ